MAALPCPTIHLNGTSKDALVKQQTDIMDAARDLLSALRESCPNGRDYYPQGDTALRAAMDYHRAACEAVEKIERDAESIALGIQERPA